ncbi:nicotinamide mononucleotide deamidase-related protein YfaY [Siccibacter colletis]|uniref:nicotinamide mononucleotide deamidase-related protein YfaY n=1 Tax=Siccibacter colletis TaxID=1505757 RepID=UPI0028BDAEDE|nr:nicotinamide mononucleotide deamidase-related protein YfaY [Siccibacter colletis]WNN47431.1 nicotinamide mononucleotide deamidase-related protein YfaY [Siccibacter colletis]
MLTVEMLSTGDEVLHGQIVDTNAAWLADYLFTQGLPFTRRNTVGDDLDSLIAILQERSTEADVIIVNGGLGPTSDDLSALAAARAAGVELELQASWLEHMTRFFESRGRVMAPSNRKQAMIPAGSEMLDNPVGTACGFALTLNRCTFFFTPGVPSEFKVMVAKEILPRIQQRFELPAPPVCLRLTTFGRSESDLAQSLSHLNLPDGVVMGYRSSMPIIELKLTGPASLRAQMEALWPEVRQVAGESLIFEGTVGLPGLLAESLRARGLRLCVSEQFTAGLLSLELNQAGAPLADGEVLAPRAESLAEIAARARALSQAADGALALVTGAHQDDSLLFALHSDAGSRAIRVQLSLANHRLPVRQAVASMIAQNMLRRLLNGDDVSQGHGWVRVTERLIL